MLRRRRPKDDVFGHSIIFREAAPPLREEIDPLPDWEGACGLYERALQHAQEGKWAEANEDRDRAREMTQ